MPSSQSVLHGIGIYHQQSETARCSPGLRRLAQELVVLVSAETKSHTDFVRQPHLRDVRPVELTVQKHVKRAVLAFDEFQYSLAIQGVFWCGSFVTVRIAHGIRIYRSLSGDDALPEDVTFRPSS